MPASILSGEKPMPGTMFRRFEGRLLDLRKVVHGIAVKDQSRRLRLQRIILVRPDLGQVERIDVIRVRFVLRHDLDADAPLRKVTLRDGVEQIALRVIRIFAAQFFGSFAG